MCPQEININIVYRRNPPPLTYIDRGKPTHLAVHELNFVYFPIFLVNHYGGEGGNGVQIAPRHLVHQRVAVDLAW